MLDNSKHVLLRKQAQRVSSYTFGTRLLERGLVLSVGDGVAWVSGLPSAAMDEVIQFEDGSTGLVFYLGRDIVGVILLSQTENLTAEAVAHTTAGRIRVPVGDELLGRVVDPLGAPLDGRATPQCKKMRAIESMAPPIIQRRFVEEPLYTGNKVVDTLIPIGKGQRQLIIGDNGLGKSSLCLDAVINQRGKGVRCIYVLIGQKRSTVASTIELLKRHDAFAHTAVIVAEATALPGMQFISPFAACAIAEEWMWQGHDTLIVYDDLTTHARNYRELSLLLRRPPGREAYPGDIFYLHSRLLERSTALSASHGGGTMTALPIVETDQGEIASYIPTNLISITDGQIYFDRKLFVTGQLPAIDVTRSVSRIGGRAQHKKVRDEVRQMKLNYLQFLEVELFTRFSAKLDPAVEQVIKRGRLLRQTLKQERLEPVAIEDQLAWLIAFNDHLLELLSQQALKTVWQDIRNLVQSSRLTLDSERRVWTETLERSFQSGLK